jgi:hypothetical protein
VGFGLTLGRLVWSVRREIAPATVGGEGGGGRPRRPQCRRAGESTGQSTCTGGFKGCGRCLLRRLNSSRGGVPWGAPVSSARRRGGRGEAARCGARANVREEGCVGRRGGANGAHASQVARPAGPRACGRGAWPWRWRAHGATRQLAARACRRAGVRVGGHEAVGPTEENRRMVLAVTAYGRWAVWARCVESARRRRREVACGARSCVRAPNQFVVPYFDRFKLRNFELKFKFAKYESCRPDNPLQLS